MEIRKIEVPVMADLFARGEKPEYLFWVGCAGAFDDRYKKVARAFIKILTHLRVNYAVLGREESCTGDPAGVPAMRCFTRCRLCRILKLLKV